MTDAQLQQQQQQQQQQLLPQQVPPTVLYREIMQECQRLMTKIAELEVDRNEHQLVEETLKPLNPDRRAYRLVGDVLVERTVKEVLPSVTANRENVSVVYVCDCDCDFGVCVSSVCRYVCVCVFGILLVGIQGKSNLSTCRYSEISDFLSFDPNLLSSW